MLSTNWGWFLVLGVVFVIGGILAIAMPLASSIAVTIVLAVVLVVAGVVQIFNSFRVQSWIGFAFQLAGGIILLIGGFAIWFQPYLGSLALTLVVAAIFIAKGISQVPLAFRVRPQMAWSWVLAAGIIALLVGLMILFRWPDSTLYTLGILAGVSLIFTGWSYLMMAFLAPRQASERCDARQRRKRRHRLFRRAARCYSPPALRWRALHAARNSASREKNQQCPRSRSPIR
jgi:uncharacterized membrane protein HdeD (DUF308 family)